MDHITENRATLASLLGIGVEHAARLLSVDIRVLFDSEDSTSALIGNTLAALLARTVRSVFVNDAGATATAAATAIIGNVSPHLESAIRVCTTAEVISIGPTVALAATEASPHPILCLAAAAYGAGVVLRSAIPALNAKVSIPEDEYELRIPTSSLLGADPAWLAGTCDLSGTYVAGAGAIGNAFVWALGHLNVQGDIAVVDPDIVSDGNLNRCVLFEPSDIGHPKAVQLASKVSSSASRLRLRPFVKTVGELAKDVRDPRWLKRLVVGVDSGRARRTLQGELPREVFDASTTDIREFVFHHNLANGNHACLGCIYPRDAQEQARERHVAEALGVTVADVCENYISENAAWAIHNRFQDIPIERIAGEAYDSLFKELCSSAQLLTDEGRHALAPFAFVSALAGIFLAVETVRRTIGSPDDNDFNYWRLSPWRSPVLELKQLLPRSRTCEICGFHAFRQAADQLWGG